MVYRVFISYAADDQVAAASLAERLEDDGFEVRFDRSVFDQWSAEESSVGTSFNRLLEGELDRSDAFVVFVDEQPNWWQEREIGAALQQQWTTRELQIVPIARPGEALTGALANRQVVEMSDDPDDPGWQGAVVRALGASPHADAVTDAETWSDDEQTKYRRRLAQIREIAAEDAEDQAEASERESWPRFR